MKTSRIVAALPMLIACSAAGGELPTTTVVKLDATGDTAPVGFDAGRAEAGPDAPADAMPETSCPDCDGDGFEPPADCDDSDPRAHPEAPGARVIAWGTPRNAGGWDFDCDGAEEPGYGLYDCGVLTPERSYVAEVPPCGGSAPAFHGWDNDGTACGTPIDVRPLAQVCR